MYIPDWLIVLAVVVIFLIYRSWRKSGNAAVLSRPTSIDDIEERVNSEFLKGSIFSLEHFDSPHFIDCQDAFDAMEVNYLRLKQRFSHNPEKALEIAKDWYKYAEALRELKSARVLLDVDVANDSWEKAEESMKEPSVIKDEIEKKFKSLLGKDWQEIPPDYLQRREAMKKSGKENEVDDFTQGDDWKRYYGDSANYYKLTEQRRKKGRNEKERFSVK